MWTRCPAASSSNRGRRTDLSKPHRNTKRHMDLWHLCESPCDSQHSALRYSDGLCHTRERILLAHRPPVAGLLPDGAGVRMLIVRRSAWARQLRDDAGKRVRIARRPPLGAGRPGRGLAGSAARSPCSPCSPCSPGARLGRGLLTGRRPATAGLLWHHVGGGAPIAHRSRRHSRSYRSRRWWRAGLQWVPVCLAGSRWGRGRLFLGACPSRAY